MHALVIKPRCANRDILDQNQSLSKLQRSQTQGTVLRHRKSDSKRANQFSSNPSDSSSSEVSSSEEKYHCFVVDLGGDIGLALRH